jgi:hypothetical protein
MKKIKLFLLTLLFLLGPTFAAFTSAFVVFEYLYSKSPRWLAFGVFGTFALFMVVLFLYLRFVEGPALPQQQPQQTQQQPAPSCPGGS